tara:strand:+ start:261 stop:470 length:210 start_codon:yes stop_codon:yes gene_type:complete
MPKIGNKEGPDAMSKTHAEYLAELDNLLVDMRGRVLTTEVSLTLAILAGRAVIAARAELLDAKSKRGER